MYGNQSINLIGWLCIRYSFSYVVNFYLFLTDGFLLAGNRHFNVRQQAV
jgi:hypothetical protein